MREGTTIPRNGQSESRFARAAVRGGRAEQAGA
jgi:hypothetical protein